MIELKKYSGHIRNHKSLCSELGVDCTLPRDEKEKQIIIAAYKKWGGDMAQHIYGMFAFALYDTDTDTLYCMRDQFGTKPFYYYQTVDGRLLYGTTIREIMDGNGFHKELNQKMLQIYLTMTYTTGDETFFKGVKKLLPGRYLTFKNGEINITRYFRPTFNPDNTKSLDEWADEIHSTLGEIMQEVKTDDEYVESFLSGGVDSSYVLAVSDAAACNSCGYDDSRLDESGLARETADILGRKFNRCLITPEAYFAAVPYVMYNMEQPLGDASAIAFALGCIATAKGTKICYSGEGADEFFGGYNMYRNAERYVDNLKTFYVGNTNIMKEDEKRKILKKYYENFEPIDLVKDIYEGNEGLDPLSKMSDVDIQVWLEGDIYLNVDKMSRAAGLEVRMPLTDMRIFDIASRMPSKYKVTAEQNKVALRTAAAKVLPEEIAFRKKLGFVVPIRMWMADSRYNGDVIRLFNSDIADKFFNRDAINKIFDDYINVDSDNWRKVWTIYTFLVWYEEYFVKR
ncbi:MAG: asparagine synthase (glutamine-hydrolyzing) [Clostridia bacterium]|nr:asparagine synthase (glutamine-hydrolyzing) [Clostridia bacterium]